jgi:hypothetical protein
VAALSISKDCWFNAESLAAKTGMSVTTVREACRSLLKAGKIQHQREVNKGSGRPADVFMIPRGPGDDPPEDDDYHPAAPEPTPVSPNPAIPVDVVAGLLDAETAGQKTLVPPSPGLPPDPPPAPEEIDPLAAGDPTLVTVGSCPDCGRKMRVTRQSGADLPCIECLCNEQAGDPAVGTGTTAGPERVTISLTLPKATYDRLVAVGILTGRSVVDLAAGAVEEDVTEMQVRLKKVLSGDC